MRIGFRNEGPNLASMSIAISTTDLRVLFGDHVALDGVTIEVPAASALAVIGPNGSGKSTLLGVLAGTIEPSSGSVHIAGRSPAFVLQSTTVDKSLPITVRDTVSLARYATLGLFGRFAKADRNAVEDAMRLLEIEDLANRQIHELSGGQRQRALVAQGVAQDAEVLLLDEPVIGLDLTTRQIILELIDDEVVSGRTVVVTTHDLDEARRCDQVLLLDTEMIAVGPPEQVLTEGNLRRAFGGNVVRVGDDFILDDPHHHHSH